MGEFLNQYTSISRMGEHRYRYSGYSPTYGYRYSGYSPTYGYRYR